MMDEEKKTLTAWAEEYDFTLLDPDGFDRTDMRLASRLFSREEWEEGWPRCTISCRRKGRAYHGTPLWCASEQTPPGGWRKVRELTVDEAFAALPEGAKMNARALAVAVARDVLGDCQSVPCGQVQPDKSVYRCHRCQEVARIGKLGSDED